MSYRKKTLRKLKPVTRRAARILGSLQSIERKLKNLLSDLERLENDSNALWNLRSFKEKKDAKSEEAISHNEQVDKSLVGW